MNVHTRAFVVEPADCSRTQARKHLVSIFRCVRKEIRFLQVDNEGRFTPDRACAYARSKEIDKVVDHALERTTDLQPVWELAELLLKESTVPHTEFERIRQKTRDGMNRLLTVLRLREASSIDGMATWGNALYQRQMELAITLIRTAEALHKIRQRDNDIASADQVQ